jgi:hypothetical protein
VAQVLTKLIGVISDPEAGLGRGLGRVHGTHTTSRRGRN